VKLTDIALRVASFSNIPIWANRQLDFLEEIGRSADLGTDPDMLNTHSNINNDDVDDLDSKNKTINEDS
jgi:hypothetical protein